MKRWYHKRTRRDAPIEVLPETMSVGDAWAAGYNAAVQTYVSELDAAMKKATKEFGE